jgi:energy-coupling factor transporter ATP-binding protein EcfA2
MDEPTALLTPQEIDDLYVILNRLKAGRRDNHLHYPQAQGGCRDQ